jgi:hypothetical protein
VGKEGFDGFEEDDVVAPRESDGSPLDDDGGAFENVREAFVAAAGETQNVVVQDLHDADLNVHVVGPRLPVVGPRLPVVDP